MEIRESLEAIIDAAIDAARADGSLELAEAPQAALERPRDEANGDWASTVAMRTAKLAHKNPREIAQIIVDHIPANDMIASVEIAGPGFINIRLSDAVLQGVVREVREEGDNFGRGTIPEGERYVNLEYVSANPTGPFHVGHGRWASLGDAMARVMRHGGYDVYEEYYINDHGNQMDVFGNSVNVRYQQLLGRDVEMPEACYGGAYVKDIAQDIIDRDGDKWLNVSDEERVEAFREMAYDMTLKNQREVLANFGTTFDKWFSERSLYVEDENGESAVSRSLDAMREKGYLYEKDGALWFRSTDLGDDKDRVLIKGDGEATYFMSDVAYHYDKMMRGFDHLIDLWGADHHGYIERVRCVCDALGYPGKFEVLLGQLVNLLRNGKPVRMSKRKGTMVTLQELVDEVGSDAARYTLISKSSNQMVDFDIEAVKKRDNSNPVYYVQYAHARVCSILRRAADVTPEQADEMGMKAVAAKAIGENVDYSLLTDPTELALSRKLNELTDLIASCARDRAPFRLTHFAEELAGDFHSFYAACQVLPSEGRPVDPELSRARLAACDAVRVTLALVLTLVGVSAPEQM